MAIGQNRSGAQLPLVILCLALSWGQAAAQSATPQPNGSKISPSKISAPSGLVFVENLGQFDAKVMFQARTGGKRLWFTRTGIVFDVTRPAPNSQPLTDSNSALTRVPKPKTQSGEFERLVFSEDFANAGVTPKIEASGLQPGIYNFFIGNDPKKWRTDVVSYSQLVYRDVWPGIDVRFVAKGTDIEQEFLVHPGADSARVHIGYRNVRRVQVGADGSLIVQTLFGPLNESAPRIYQETDGRRTSVSGHR